MKYIYPPMYASIKCVLIPISCFFHHKNSSMNDKITVQSTDVSHQMLHSQILYLRLYFFLAAQIANVTWPIWLALAGRYRQSEEIW